MRVQSTKIKAQDNKGKSLIEILRPLNCFTAAVATVIGYWFVKPLDPTAVLAGLVTFLICGYGNTINDVFDIQIDKKIKPHRPLPRGALTLRQAQIWSYLLAVLGLGISYTLGFFPFIVTAIAIAGLYIYPAKMKENKLLGNFLVSFFVGLPIVFGGMVAGSTSLVLALGAIVFFINFAREIVKDIEDFKAAEKGTLPKRFGLKKAALASILLLFLGMAFGLLVTRPYHSLEFLVTLMLGYAFFATASVLIWNDHSKENAKIVSGLIKAGMMVSLMAFVVIRLNISLF